jgi:hypothetical protein
MKTLKVRNITQSQKTTVYDISVNRYENYILENGIITHNSGLKYAASTIAMLSKSKDKEGTDVVGNIIKVKLHKSRFTKENSQVEVKLSYDHGLDRYYGLLDLAEKAGIFKKTAGRYELPDGTKVFGKAINGNPEKYFTQDILSEIDKFVAKKFLYGQGDNGVDDEVIDNGED